MTATVEPTVATAPLPALDMARAGQFAGQLLYDMRGAMTSLLCALGDRLGLFRALAAGGPVRSEELAVRAGVHERYVRDWMSAMASAGYVEYDPAGGGRFVLPPEHAAALAW